MIYCQRASTRWMVSAVLLLGLFARSFSQSLNFTNATNATMDNDILEPVIPPQTLSQEYCDNLRAGDILIFVVETNGPKGVLIGFLALVELRSGLMLHLTDRPWNGEMFLDTPKDGEVLLTIQEGQDIEGAQRFGYGESTFQVYWEGDPLSLNTEVGDTIVLYCLDTDDNVNPIVGYSNTGSWEDNNTTEFSDSNSILPEKLWKTGSVVLPHLDNYEYVGPNLGNKEQLQAFMSDPNNWNGTDNSLLIVVEEDVVVENSTSTTIVANPDALDAIIPVTAPPAEAPAPASAPSPSSDARIFFPSVMLSVVMMMGSSLLTYFNFV